jgi:hypothetical protein
MTYSYCPKFCWAAVRLKPHAFMVLDHLNSLGAYVHAIFIWGVKPAFEDVDA